MPKLAIISSYDENCGNASYTHVLRSEFSRRMDVEVIALDLFTLQKPGVAAREIADDHIRQICRRLAKFDYVNIQFEAGLYGATISDIRRRIFWLIEASRNLIFTMHRIDLMTQSKSQIIWEQVRRRQFSSIRPALGRAAHEHLYFDIIQKCKKESLKKNLWICVHTQRELRIVRDYYKMQNCFDHPLAFLTPDERNAVWAMTDRSAFRVRYNFPVDAKVIGLFGYISEYKGLETALRALPLLPHNYMIALFGSQHPQSIRASTAIDPYLSHLINTIEGITEDVVTKRLKKISALPKASAEELDKHDVASLVDLQYRDRLRFMGNLDDPQFIEALRLCDAVVLPYMEVGQSMSGVIALGVESGANMFCSNNLSFFEVKKYYGDAFHSFDIGNYVELSQKIQSESNDFKNRRDLIFSKFNIETLVNCHLRKFGYDNKGAEV